MPRDFDDFFNENYAATVRSLELDGTPGEKAHDAAQEAYVRAYARWWRVGRSRDPVAWVRRVAVHVARDDRRHRRVEETAVPALAAGTTRVESLNVSEHLDEILETLPSPQQRAVDLYYRAGYSTDEAASRMGISPDAFRFHLGRARRTLKPRVVEQLGRTEMAR